MKIVKLVLLLVFLATTAHAGKVEIGVTHDLILNTPAIWSLVQADIADPLEVKGQVARNASHAVWKSVIDTAAYVNNAMLYSCVIPFSIISGARVPDGWPGAWKTDEEGNQTVRKRWWEYTRSYLSPDKTEFLMYLNGPMSNMQLVDNRLTSGNYLGGGTTDQMLKAYIAIIKSAVPTCDGFLTYNEGQAIIQSWNLSSE